MWTPSVYLTLWTSSDEMSLAECKWLSAHDILASLLEARLVSSYVRLHTHTCASLAASKSINSNAFTLSGPNYIEVFVPSTCQRYIYDLRRFLSLEERKSIHMTSQVVDM